MKDSSNESICWTCWRNIYECSWFLDFIPVEGWGAEKQGNSFHIYYCPLYTENKEDYNKFFGYGLPLSKIETLNNRRIIEKTISSNQLKFSKW